MKGLYACRHHDLTDVDAPGNCDQGLVVSQYVDVANRYRVANGIDDPNRRMPMDLRQRACRDLDGEVRFTVCASGDGRPSRMAAGGSVSPTLTVKVRVTGSACGATSRTRPRATTV